MTDKELIKWLKDKIIYFSNEESKTEDDYWKGKSRGTKEAFELILKMLEIRNYTSAGVNTNALPYKIAILDDYGNSASVNAKFLPYKITVSDGCGTIGEYLIPTGIRGDTINLCDNCKFTNDCNPTLTDRVGARTTECSRYERADKEVDDETDN